MIYPLLFRSLITVAGIVAAVRKVLAARRNHGPIVLHLAGTSKLRAGS